MTEGYSKQGRVLIAKRGVFTGTTTLIVFALLRSIIFSFFGITLEAFQIMGLILMVIAVQFVINGVSVVLNNISNLSTAG